MLRVGKCEFYQKKNKFEELILEMMDLVIKNIKIVVVIMFQDLKEI